MVEETGHYEKYHVKWIEVFTVFSYVRDCECS